MGRFVAVMKKPKYIEIEDHVCCYYIEIEIKGKKANKYDFGRFYDAKPWIRPDCSLGSCGNNIFVINENFMGDKVKLKLCKRYKLTPCEYINIVEYLQRTLGKGKCKNCNLYMMP